MGTKRHMQASRIQVTA
ncbi:hypothetical protein Goari_009963 [Gossypium aridum]|uniref:Uncharacterized protein n=1 Tax=Gossypium aridum TaxID=34290 RepID=A0A7J8XYJ5_GOSAI|nr:hypothetical protein [Gossypium aridum]